MWFICPTCVSVTVHSSPLMSAAVNPLISLACFCLWALHVWWTWMKSWWNSHQKKVCGSKDRCSMQNDEYKWENKSLNPFSPPFQSLPHKISRLPLCLQWQTVQCLYCHYCLLVRHCWMYIDIFSKKIPVWFIVYTDELNPLVRNLGVWY